MKLLEIGYNHPFEVRCSRWGSGANRLCSIMYLSDFHFNHCTLPTAYKIADTISQLQPDIVLLGGDYADTPAGLHSFKLIMQSLASHKHVYAIPGNHDLFFMRQLRHIVTDHNGHWLQEQQVSLHRPGHSMLISGGINLLPPAGKHDINICLLHQPLPINLCASFQLVFAGHLHGGQVVLHQTEKGLYPGRWFYGQNFLYKNTSGCHYYISKGLGDTLPIRYNCKKDIIFVDLYF